MCHSGGLETGVRRHPESVDAGLSIIIFEPPTNGLLGMHQATPSTAYPAESPYLSVIRLRHVPSRIRPRLSRGPHDVDPLIVCDRQSSPT